jgi:group II intron reverse transcriptase/maturase
MQKTENILQALHRFGEKEIPLERIYRHLYNPDLYLVTYDQIGRHPGSMTPGIDGVTADGTRLATFERIIDAMRHERYYKPVKRIYIPKRSGQRRPLGLPRFADKLVQAALKLLLEAYYEPLFRQSSHGFRPGRGCHTALKWVHRQFQGSTWFIEGDIKGCFEHIDHDLLLAFLARRIHDGRVLELIRRYLKAGYLEDWRYHRTDSGTPQGGVLSPLLANIYLHELDRFIEDELMPRYNCGARRQSNPAYNRLSTQIHELRRQGLWQQSQALVQQRTALPSVDTHDPCFRRLSYCRYAEDFLLGFIGPKEEALQIKAELAEFLQQHLHLELSQDKTQITHAKTEHARFLNYAISTYQTNTYRSCRKNGERFRSINGKIRLGIPFGLVDELCRRYLSRGKPIHRAELLMYSDAHIISTYQSIFRGIAEYYQYAADRHALGKLKYVMECSLTKTLAHKHKTTVAKVYRHYRGRHMINGQHYKTLEVSLTRSDGELRVIRWGAISLAVRKDFQEPLKDQRIMNYPHRSDLTDRLVQAQCELCGRKGPLEVHHVRKLADLKERWRGRRDKPSWVKTMIAIRRKTLVVCKQATRPFPTSHDQLAQLLCRHDAGTGAVGCAEPPHPAAGSGQPQFLPRGL